MPRNYNPITGHELAQAIELQIRKALLSHPDIFGHHLTYRAFRFAVGVHIDFLDGRGEGQVAQATLPQIEAAQGEFSQQVADPRRSGKVWVGVGFEHLLTLPPDAARAELHLPQTETLAEGGQIVEKAVPPPFDPILDGGASGDGPEEEGQVQSQGAEPLPHQLSDAEIEEMFEAPPPPAAPAAAKATPPAPPVPAQAQEKLDPKRAAQLSAQARANQPPAANNPFDRSGPIEPRDVQSLRPRPPHQTPQERAHQAKD